MWGKINDLEIKAPSIFSSTDEVIGGFNVTLKGTKRRYIKAVKKVWKLGYNFLTTDEYDNIYTEFAKEIPSSIQESQTYAIFTVYESSMNINKENVHISISSRNIVPGTNYLSNVEITLTQI